MSDTDLRDFFARYLAVLNAHDLERLSEFVHDDVVLNGQLMTREDMVDAVRGHIDAVPDLTWRVADLVIDGDTVAARFLNTGTPVKAWFGAGPNGRAVEYAEHVLHKVRDGRFFEQNFLLDVAAVRDQLSS